MTEKYLAETVLAFVKDSSYQMGVHRIKKDQCRIAFPSYLERSFLSGMVEIYGPMHFQSEKLTNIKGIEVHPTWENAITFYYIHSVRFPEENIPVFKLNFDTKTVEIPTCHRTEVKISKIQFSAPAKMPPLPVSKSDINLYPK